MRGFTWLVLLGIHNGMYGDAQGMFFVDTWASVALIFFGVALSLSRELAVDRAQLYVIQDRENYNLLWLRYTLPVNEADKEAHETLRHLQFLALVCTRSRTLLYPLIHMYTYVEHKMILFQNSRHTDRETRTP